MIYNTPKEIMSEIKHQMDLNDIPMKELASRMNTSQQNLSKIFTNANPQCKTLLEICDALNLDIDITFYSKGDTFK